jgi:hypothetical protein
MLLVVEGGGKEPIGNRIIETAEDLERTELRDSASGFVAYVPTGSIKKGEAPVTGRAGNKTIRCAICHGVDLRYGTRAFDCRPVAELHRASDV